MVRQPLAVAALAVAAAAALIPVTPASAGAKDSWALYSSMSACKNDRTRTNGLCAGLQDGRAIGLVDTALATDEHDQAAGTFYDDENPMPTVDGKVVPVVEVWNNSTIIATISPDPLRKDAMDVAKIWAILPGVDAVMPNTSAAPRAPIPPTPFPSHGNTMPNWNWTASARSQYTSQSQNGLVNLATGGNLCAGLLGVLAPTNNCPNS